MLNVECLVVNREVSSTLGVVAKLLNCENNSKQVRTLVAYYFPIRTIALAKGKNPIISLAMG